MKPLPHLTPITEPVRELDRAACGLPPREPTTEENLRMRIAFLEDQISGLFEINYKLHEQSGHLESIARQAMQLLEKNLPKLP